MKIKNHGDWTRYRPDTLPEGFPANAMFARRSDGTDWYGYVGGDESFEDDSIKMTVLDGVVMAAVTDPTMLFPAGTTVLEVSGVAVDDPQALFGDKVYDEARGAFTAPAPAPAAPDRLADLLKRVEALEGKAP